MPIRATLTKARVPIKLWTDLDTVESGALDQLTQTANLPFVFKHVAAMPDVHVGIGATVGSVVATQNAIVPACVGVDIGCGMMAVKTPLRADEVAGAAGKIRSFIESAIPVGFQGNKSLTDTVKAWKGWKQFPVRENYVDKTKIKSQLGSLGGGNHFIEVCLDKTEAVWVMLHSGSRNVGKTIAEAYIKKAQALCAKNLVRLPHRDLAYLEEGSGEFTEYLAALEWCQAYAQQNRTEMMNRILDRLARELNSGEPIKRLIEVNCHHNYVARERHFGENVLLTRKGAVRAQKGELGIIPGSMGAASFIVRGLGNAESFHSCSHGAGRTMSRAQAKKRFNLKDLARQTAGVECRKDRGILDEIPGAYKDIKQVMANQSDLVEVVAELKQVLCVKG